MHYNQPIDLEHNDQSILAGKEHVHVGDDLVVNDDQQSKGEKRSILKNYVQEYSPSVNGAATVAGTERGRLYNNLYIRTSLK